MVVTRVSRQDFVSYGMGIDYHLVAQAQKYAGESIHKVAQDLAIYTLNVGLSEDNSLKKSDKLKYLLAAQEAEKKIRQRLAKRMVVSSC
jgi:hypothetical protein